MKCHQQVTTICFRFPKAVERQPESLNRTTSVQLEHAWTLASSPREQRLDVAVRSILGVVGGVNILDPYGVDDQQG